MRICVESAYGWVRHLAIFAVPSIKLRNGDPARMIRAIIVMGSVARLRERLRLIPVAILKAYKP
jgi:hypothetical protein